MDWTTVNERDKGGGEREREKLKKKRKRKKKESQLQYHSKQQIKSFCQKGRKPLCSLMMVRQCDASQDLLDTMGYNKLRKVSKTTQ